MASLHRLHMFSLVAEQQCCIVFTYVLHSFLPANRSKWRVVVRNQFSIYFFLHQIAPKYSVLGL